jgi:hypothetical protein
MPAPTPLPVRASLRDLMSDLLGRPVTIAPGEPQSLDEAQPAMAAVYRRDDGTVAAVGISARRLAISSGAAIGMMPESEIAGSDLDGDVLEFFNEVVNVLAKLLNSPTTPHVVLREVVPVPGLVDPDVAALVTNPTQRLDYQVTVEGYGGGTLTLVG